MVKGRLSLLFLIIWFIYVSYIFLLPAHILGKQNAIAPIVKKYFLSLTVSALKYGFNPNIFYSNQIVLSENKVDILLANHLSTIDWAIIYSMLNKFKINNFIMVGKKGLIYFPGFGFHFMSSNHIKLERKWEEDKETLSRQIDKIDNGLIIIFPEGTRFEPEKHKKGQQYSMESGLPVYNNLLVPKSKGLWTIYNQLKSKNKLGKIFDMSIVMENFFRENAYLSDLDKKETGNIYVINRELQHPDKYIENEDFKSWLLKEWKKKDNLMGMYNKLFYNKLDLEKESNYNEVYKSLLVMVIFAYLFYKRKEVRYYFLIVLVLSYIITTTKKY